MGNKKNTADEQITQTLKKLSVLGEQGNKHTNKTSGVWGSNLPYLLYVWKDDQRTEMVSIEMHLPAASIDSICVPP